MDIFAAILMVLVVLSPVFFILWLMARRQLAAKSTEAANLTGKVAAMTDRYAPIVSQDEEVSRLKGIVTGLENDIQKLRDSYAEKRRYFDTLQEQVAIFDERLAFAEMGVYAFPPCSRICTATLAASGCDVAHIPFVA